MMKLIVLSLFAAVAYAGQMRALTDIPSVSAAVQVTATYPSVGTAPVVTTLTNDNAYNSNAVTLGAFTIGGTATYTLNNTLSGCAITYSNGGDNVVLSVGAVGSCSSPTQCTAILTGGGFPVFKNTATYTVSSILCATDNGFNYNVPLPATTTNVAATGWAAPTITAYNLVSPQNGGCDDLGCDNNINGTATTTARASLFLSTILRNPAANSGVRYVTTATVSAAGASDFNTDTVSQVSANVGGLVNGLWLWRASLAASLTLVPKNQAMSVSAQVSQISSGISRVASFPESFFGGALSSSVTLTVGSTDVTPPTCSVATLSPATITTTDVIATGTLTVTCTDEAGGSGLWMKGAFLQASITNGPGATFTIPSPVSGATATFSVIPYVSGTLSITGVYAVDNAGNSVVYGSCGNAQGYDTMGCAGAGGSSASTVAISMFSLVFLAIYALFA